MRVVGMDHSTKLNCFADKIWNINPNQAQNYREINSNKWNKKWSGHDGQVLGLVMTTKDSLYKPSQNSTHLLGLEIPAQTQSTK